MTPYFADPTGYFGTVVDEGGYEPEIKPLDGFDSDVDYDFQTSSNLNIGNYSGLSGSMNSDVGDDTTRGSGENSIDQSNVEFYYYGPPANDFSHSQVPFTPDNTRLEGFKRGLARINHAVDVFIHSLSVGASVEATFVVPFLSGGGGTVGFNAQYTDLDGAVIYFYLPAGEETSNGVAIGCCWAREYCVWGW